MTHLLISAAILAITGIAPVRTEIKVVRDYLEPGRTETLDVYLPTNPASDSKGSLAVIWIHRGGWMSGTKTGDRAQEICVALAETGHVVVSIDYKLDNGAWHHNLYDCKNAIRFLRARAERYGVDPHRKAVAGVSAGGHLALMVTLTAEHAALEPTAPYPGILS